MNLEMQMSAFALHGAAWVLWLLVALSVLSLAIILERAVFYWRRRVNIDSLIARMERPLRAGELPRLSPARSMEHWVAGAGLGQLSHGAERVADAMRAEELRTRADYERGLSILATLGANAPFVGLFGTVLGVIRAFADLSRGTAAGASAVMAGISEALVATAVGLAVALPAVAAYNIFQRRLSRSSANSERLLHHLVAYARSYPRSH